MKSEAEASGALCPQCGEYMGMAVCFAGTRQSQPQSSCKIFGDC